MKTAHSATMGVMLIVALLAGCDNSVPAIREKIANPTCEDLGKIKDDAEHKALLAKCPDYLRGGTKKSKPMEWF